MIINIACPFCFQRGEMNISDNIIEDSEGGLICVAIAPNTICSHSYLAYIDKNCQVRDYFNVDFHVEFPQTSSSKEIDFKTIPSKDLLNLDLIKLNIPATLIANILKAIFFKKDIIIISDLAFMKEHILNFFKYITKDTFNLDILILAKEQYIKNKKKYKKRLVFDGISVIKNFDKIISSKDIKVEKQLIMNFLTENDPLYSVIVLKNEIQKAYFYAKDIIKLLENYDGKEKLGKKQLINILSESNRINITYLDFLLDIVKYYFNYNHPSLSEFIIPAFGI